MRERKFDKKAFRTSQKRKEKNGNFTLGKSILRNENFPINLVIALRTLSKTA